MKKNIEQILLPANGSLDLTVVKTVNMHEEIYWSVLIGLAEIERLPHDKNHIVFKILVGRFYNTGHRLNNLSQVFGVSEKTIRKWGNALKLGSVEEMNRSFAGNANKLKFTNEVLGYAKGVYIFLKGQVKNYRQLTIEAVKERYKITISGERLRQLLLIEKTQEENESSNSKEIESNDFMETRPDNQKKEKLKNLDEIESNSLENIQKTEGLIIPENLEETEDLGQSKKDKKGNCSCEVNSISGQNATPSSNYFPFLGLPLGGVETCNKPVLLQHCGLLLFSPWIDLVFPEKDSENNLNKQWLSHFLLGGVNIEQSKHISFESLEKLIGPVIKDKGTQRSLLKEQASLNSVLDLCERNGRLINSGLIDEISLYYDPHTKEYTGMHPWLKAWIAHSKKIAKGMHSDFIHTTDGSPCFVQIFDNYYDLRERFFICIQSFKKLYPTQVTNEQRFTWIVDRGIFGIDTLLQINELGDNIITWEKGYKQNGWDSKMPYKVTELSKPKNNSKDIVRTFFQYQESEWEVNSEFKKIIVRAKKANGNEIEVAIIVTALCCFSAEKIIKLMFNKWIQENDFKFLSAFFGIDQIISYRYFTYEEIAHLFQDRLIEAQEYKEVNKERLLLEKKLTQAVRSRYNQENKMQKKLDKLNNEKRKRIDKLKSIDSQIKSTSNQTRAKKLIKNAKKLKILIARYPSREEKLQKSEQGKIDKLSDEISNFEHDIQEFSDKLMILIKSESRLECLIEGEYVIPDVAAKNHIDSIKIMARNIFYELLKIFRPMYDNFRDDCAILRELTRLSGLVMKKGNVICINLWSQADYPKKNLEVIEQFISTMTFFINAHFENRASKIQIQLLPSSVKIEDIINPAFLSN